MVKNTVKLCGTNISHKLYFVNLVQEKKKIQKEADTCLANIISLISGILNLLPPGPWLLALPPELCLLFSHPHPHSQSVEKLCSQNWSLVPKRLGTIAFFSQYTITSNCFSNAEVFPRPPKLTFLHRLFHFIGDIVT